MKEHLENSALQEHNNSDDIQEKSASYILITKQCLECLEKENIPQNIFEKLATLEDRKS